MSQRFLNTREAAHRISERYFTVSHRTIDTWSDLKGRVINRQKWLTVEEVDAAAQRRIEAAEQKRATLSAVIPA